ncbi:MAG: contractile injection system tape measure protein [Bacteroidia bacterium]
MKAPEQSHFIQRFKFDFEIESKEDAHRLHNDLSRLFNQRIKGMLDDIMSELDDPNVVIRIPSLEIDLGEIYEASFDKEVLMRFEHAFRRELAMRIGELRHAKAVVASSKGEVVKLTPARIEIVAYFLVNGRLPTGAEQMAGQVEALFMELIDTDEELVRAMLAKVVTKENAMIRLAMSFSERLVTRLYRLILPDTAVSLPKVEQQLVAEAQKVSKRSLASLTREVRRAMMTYLLQPSNRVFDKAKLVKSVKQSLGRVFKEIQPEWVEAESAAPTEQGFGEQKDKLARTEAAIDVLKRYLRGAAPLPDTINVVEAWEHLVAADPVALRKFLASGNVSSTDIKTLLRTVPAASIKDLVTQLVPNAPMQMLHVATAVNAAFATYSKGASAEQRIANEVYVTLIEQLVAGTSTPSVAKVAEAIKARLKKITEVPKELIRDWADLGLPGSQTAAQKRAEQARKDAEAATAEREFQEKIAELKARPKANAPEGEAPEGPEAEKAAKESEKKKGKAKAKGTVEEVEDMDDETFFREARERLRKLEEEGFEVLPGIDPESIPTEVITAAGKAELVFQAMARGERPWWAPPLTTVQLEMHLRTALSDDAPAVKETFHQIVRSLGAAQRKALILKLLDSLNEGTMTQLVTSLAPDISGFLVTVSMALKALRQYAEGSDLAIPSELSTEAKFVWQPILEYIVEYLSGGLSVGQAVRFVLRQLAAPLGLSPRVMIERMTTIAEEAIAKGEKRFNVFKSVMPKTFEGLQVPPPTPHEPVENPWSALAPLKAALEAELAATPEKEIPVIDMPELTGVDQRVLLQRLLAARDEELKARQEQEAVTAREAEEPLHDGQVKPLLEADGPEGKSPEGKVPEDEVPESKIPESITPEMTEPGTVLPETATTEPSEPHITPGIEAGKEPATRPEEKVVRSRERLTREQVLERIAREKPRFDTVEESESDIVIATIRQYLEHGTLTSEATAFFTESTFKAMVLGTLRLSTKPMAAMLRDLMTKSGPRARVMALGDEAALLLIGVLQPMIAERMRPFTVELLRIAGMGGGPISRVHVLDQAIRFALRAHGTAFSPMTYVQEFVDYVDTLPGRKAKDMVIWAIKRLEGRSTPLAETLMEVLDVVERAETQAVKRKKPAPSTTRPEQVMIKAPDGDIYVSNCGATLIFAVFQTLFHSFKLLTEDKKQFVSLEAATRAAHYIQYMTDQELDPPEEKMVLNKLLVGLPVDKPLEPLSEPLTEDERDTCDYMVNFVLEKWTVMKNAGPDYLRKTFLQREGRLQDNVTNWILRVQQNGLDLLKNKIPWSTNPVRLPWLSYTIEVDWP